MTSMMWPKECLQNISVLQRVLCFRFSLQDVLFVKVKMYKKIKKLNVNIGMVFM